MNKVLMILTNARRDCLGITFDMLAKSEEHLKFDKIVFLLNGVTDTHRNYVKKFIHKYPHASFDIIEGPGTRPEGISWMQNQCIQKYPNSFYVKIDEDIFVSSGWADDMFEAYETYKERDDLALITPLIPNNAYGLHALATRYYPELLQQHRTLFDCEPTTEPQGFTWHSPTVAEWASRAFLNLEDANDTHIQLLTEQGHGPYSEFCKYFSIGCIGYDYRHIQNMGGVPTTDEPGWCTWIEENKALNILINKRIVLHYAFFVQQEWLDRSSLLEDIRHANLPDTIKKNSLFDYHRPRIHRRLLQLPGILKRRLSRQT